MCFCDEILDQIGEELEVTGRGSGQARADFVVWRLAQDKADRQSPLIVVECKSDNVTITADDGFPLKAMWQSAGKSGPGVLLLHQCNADRRIYDNLATMLSAVPPCITPTLNVVTSEMIRSLAR